MERRSFLTGLGLLLPAPAIVHATSLMPIKVPLPDWITAHENNLIWGTLVVRKPGAKLLSEFEGVIKPGEFLWRTPSGPLIDLYTVSGWTRASLRCCTFPQTWVRVTPSLIEWRRPNGTGASNYLERGAISAPGQSLPDMGW